MNKAKQNAEWLVNFLKEAVKKDIKVQQLFKDFEFIIVDDQDGFIVSISENILAHCGVDGSVTLKPSLLEDAKGLVKVPVLTPLTKESFKLAMVYYTELKFLNKQQSSQLVLLKLSNAHPFESGGLWC
jgi:hypothetical protein